MLRKISNSFQTHFKLHMSACTAVNEGSTSYCHLCHKKGGWWFESHYLRRKYTGINNYRANFDTLTEPIGKQKREKETWGQKWSTPRFHIPPSE